MTLSIHLSEDFKRSFKKLHPQEKRKFYDKLTLFVENQRHPSLRTKKLKGHKILFESSISMSIRIVWRYESNKMILLLDIGHHDVLNRQ